MRETEKVAGFDVSNASAFEVSLAQVQKILSDTTSQAEDVARAATWVQVSWREKSEVYEWYRGLGKDIEKDCLAYVDRLKVEPLSGDRDKAVVGRAYAAAFRFLMRRHAWWSALAVWKELARIDRVGWTVYRLVSMAMPRVLLAVVAGYTAILGSSELEKVVSEVAQRPWTIGWWWWLGITLSVSLWLCVAEAQRRVGRDGLRVVRRGLWLFGLSLGYSIALGMLTANYVWQRPFVLEANLPCGGELVLAGGAMTLSHIIQLFWEEGSLGDPV